MVWNFLGSITVRGRGRAQSQVDWISRPMNYSLPHLSWFGFSVEPLREAQIDSVVEVLNL